MATNATARRTPTSSLDLPVTALPGVGTESGKLLERLRIRTIGDLLWHLPTRYLDFSKFVPLRDLRPGKQQTVEAILGRMSQRRTARGLLMTEVELNEPATGMPSGVKATWFGRQFIKERFPEGQLVRLAGDVKWFGRSAQLSNPKIEPATAEAVHTGRIVPVYGLTEGLKEGVLRRWLHTAVEGGPKRSAVVNEVPERLPEQIRERRHLLGVRDALREIHFPSEWPALFAARRRLAFEELLVLQLALGQRRARWTKDAKALAVRVDDGELDGWIAALPFELTAGQQAAIAKIRDDLARRVPMSRLLEGDVGSGKTVVAALAARMVVSAGAQAALMAPTELLAEQHYASVARLFGGGGPRVALLTSNVTGAARRQTRAAIESGDIDVVVGTHALVEESVAFHRLAIAIVDEQHRFGVRQRALFRDKGIDPHLLLTTATPIPQTLSQTLYRDLDITELREHPSGGQQIETVLRTEEALPKMWPWLRERVAQGEQAFVVTPRIEDAGDDDVPSAEKTYRDLASKELKGLRLALLHGRMPAKERDAAMARFAARDIDVLVATTVIEVGIDIPEATVMVILGAERFGLAQLHQLRGRVGRRGQRAWCVLVSEKAAESERLAAMTEVSDRTGKPLDGFELAKRDLAIRGAGEFLGEAQSGMENELRIVDLADIDPALLDETAVETDRILAEDPQLERPEHAALAAAVADLWRRYALA